MKNHRRLNVLAIVLVLAIALLTFSTLAAAQHIDISNTPGGGVIQVEWTGQPPADPEPDITLVLVHLDGDAIADVLIVLLDGVAVAVIPLDVEGV